MITGKLVTGRFTFIQWQWMMGNVETGVVRGKNPDFSNSLFNGAQK